MKNRVTLCKYNAETGEFTSFDALIAAFRDAADEDRYDIFHKILSLGIFAMGDEIVEETGEYVLFVDELFPDRTKFIEMNDGMIWVDTYDRDGKWTGEMNDEDLSDSDMEMVVNYLDENLEMNLQH